MQEIQFQFIINSKQKTMLLIKNTLISMIRSSNRKKLQSIQPLQSKQPKLFPENQIILGKEKVQNPQNVQKKLNLLFKQNLNYMPLAQKQGFFTCYLPEQFLNSLHQKFQNMDPIVLPELIYEQESIPLEKIDQQQQKNQFSQLIKLIQKAINSSQKTKQKNVLFLLGKTGSGKSTMIHFLCGIQIKDVAKQFGDQLFLHIPELELQKELPGFEVGHLQFSMTKQVNVIQINNLTFVDTAGLSDTNGSQYDIANTIGLEKALHNFKSVKMLFLIQQSSIFGDQRSGNLIKLVRQLVGYVKDLKIEKFIPTVTIIISHPVYSSTYLHKRLKEIKSAQVQIPTIQDTLQRQNVLQFIECMILGAEFQQKREKIKGIKRQYNKIKQKINQIQSKINEEGLDRIQNQIINANEDLKMIRDQQQKIDQIKYIERLNQRCLKIRQDTKYLYIQIDQKKQQLKTKQQFVLSEQNILKLLIQNSSLKYPLFNSFDTFPAQRLTDHNQLKQLIQKISKSQANVNTSKIFQVSIKGQAKEYLQKIISKIQLRLNGMLNKKMFTKAQKCLDQIFYLSNYINIQQVQKSRKDSEQNVAEYIKNQCISFKSQINAVLSQKGILTNEGLYQIKEDITNIYRFECLLAKLPQETLNKLQYSFDGISKHLVQKFAQRCDYNLEILRNQSNISQIYYSMTKLQTVYQHCSDKIIQLKEIYNHFAQQFEKILKYHIQKSIDCIYQGQYIQLINNLRYISEVKTISEKHFKCQIEEVQTEIVNQANQALNVRSQNAFVIQINKINDQDIKLIQQAYNSLAILKNNLQLNKYIGSQTLNNCYNYANNTIINACNNLINICKEKINKKKLQQLQKPLLTLKNIRQISQVVSSNTCDEYAKLISKIQIDITQTSINSINQIMNKIKYGTVQQQDIEQLTESIKKLQKLTWLQAVIQKGQLKQILQNVNLKLTKRSIQILNSIQKDFYSEINQIDKFDSGFDSNSDISDSASNIGRLKNMNGTKRFKSLNFSIKLIESWSEINSQIKKIYSQVKTQIDLLVKKQCQKAQQAILNNLEEFSLHKVELDKLLIKINYLQCIYLAPIQQVRQTLDKMCKQISNYLSGCLISLDSIDINEYISINNLTYSFTRIIKSLINCDHITGNRLLGQIVKTNLQRQLKRKLNDIFETIFQQTQLMINIHSFKQAKQNLIVIKKYRNTQVNQFLGNEIKDQYDPLYHKYNTKLCNFTEDSQKLITNNKFQELKVLIKKFQQNGNLLESNCLKDNIFNTVSTLYQDIHGELASLQSGDVTKTIALNKNIKKYNLFNKVKDLIPQFQYQSNLQNIGTRIKDFYNKSCQQVNNLLKNKMFKLVKEKSQKLNQICINLSDGLELKGLLIKIDYQTIINAQIKNIVEDKLLTDNFETYFKNLQKLKQIKNEDGSQIYNSFKGKIKLHILSKCKESRDKLQIPSTFQQIDIESTKLKNLQQQTSEYLLLNNDFPQIISQFTHIQNIINEVSELIRSGDKYNLAFLNRLKNSQNQVNYYKTLRQIDVEIKNICLKLEDSIKRKNYKDYSVLIKDAQKFSQIEIHLQYSRQFENLMKQKNSIIKRGQYLKQMIKNQLQKSTVDKNSDFTNFQQYLMIQAYVDFRTIDDKVIIQDSKEIYLKIIQCLRRLIPKVGSKLNFVECNYRLEALKKYQKFINLLKVHACIISSQGKFSNIPSQLLPQLQSIQSVVQSQQKLSSQIQNLPEQIKIYWKQNQFKKIIETLNDIKMLKSQQSDLMFPKLGESLKVMIYQLAQQTITNIEANNFIGVNDNINKINKIQSQLKSIPGLINKKSQFQKIIDSLDNHIQKGIVNNIKSKLTTQKASQIVQDLIQLKNWVNKLPVFQKYIDKYIEETLKLIKTKKLTRIVAANLQALSQDTQMPQQATACAQIKYKYAKLLQIPRIIPKIRSNVEDAIKQFLVQKPNTINKQELTKSFQLYVEEYQKLKHKYISSSTRGKILDNLKAIKVLVKECAKQLSVDKNLSYQNRKNLPKLLARLFCYLSIMRSAQQYYDAEEMKQSKSSADDFLLQPHTIQVLSILRFIGCDKNQGWFGKIKDLFSKNQKLPNHLMQIKTGQGKSIILGIMSLLLALMGNQVYTVCYSTILSSRDHQSFKDTFKAFDVQDRVKYGTFAEISEQIINQKGDVRNIVNNLFSPRKTNISIKDIRRESKINRILLVDEVDTFFTKDFYGNTYNPCTILNTPQISKIIRLIWKHRHQNSLQIQNLLKQTPQYKKVSDVYNDCIKRINQQFRLMTIDVKNFNKKQYVAQDGKIAYKQLDGLSFNSVMGYQTMFAYMQQHERGNVQDETLEQIMGISLSCGNFSYAQMIQSFDKIFGVTGTLQNLTEFQSKILERYKISLKTFAPSVYGDSNRQIKPTLIQKGVGKHFQIIAASINQSLNSKRAVLVFFKDEQTLTEFKQSNYTEHFRDRMNIVTQKSLDRDFFIRKATSSNKVTLFTAPFGRGTDFIIYDPLVKQEGVYVIQTFLSEEQSEQIQVKGRCARQGAKGTYQLILNLQKLTETYKITGQMITKVKQSEGDTLAKLFQRKRLQFAKKTNQLRQKQIIIAKYSHQKSIQKRNLILSKTIARDDLFFFTTGRSTSKVKIMILIDSTGSMGKIIMAVKGKVMDMISKLAFQYPNEFQIQIMFYYGHDSYSAQNNSAAWYATNKLHVSQWTDDVNLLKTFLTTANANGGSEHEAIQVALHHLVKENQQNGVKKALFIGDAGLQGKLDSSIDYCVHPSNAGRYKPAQIAKPIKLVFSNLLNQLKSKGVQVDTYPIGNGQQIQLTCKQLSDCTGGKTKAFDPNKDNLAAQLEATITSCIMMKR